METGWREVNYPARPDIIGERVRDDGITEFLMHNKAMCFPYYVADAQKRTGPQ